MNLDDLTSRAALRLLATTALHEFTPEDRVLFPGTRDAAPLVGRSGRFWLVLDGDFLTVSDRGAVEDAVDDEHARTFYVDVGDE